MKRLIILFFVMITCLSANSYIIKQEPLTQGKDYFVEKICVDTYVYINMYQKKPVMTIVGGSSTAYTSYPVLQGITQSLILNKNNIVPERCK